MTPSDPIQAMLDVTHTECGIFGAHANNKIIERHLSLVNIALHIRNIIDNNNPTVMVNLGSLCLVKFNRCLFVTDNVPQWFNDAAVLDSPSWATGQ